MQKRIACRLVNVIPNLVNGYKQWQLKFLACGVLYHRVIHPELHDNVVLRQVFPYGFGLSEQDKRRIVQLSVFQQIQIRQHLFVGVSPEKWISCLRAYWLFISAMASLSRSPMVSPSHILAEKSGSCSDNILNISASDISRRLSPVRMRGTPSNLNSLPIGREGTERTSTRLPSS